ncbi:MAG: hypothetical protein MZV63_37270 [Marinilabiliales bacterium]|nr:hypothetical protein [Marinilabiliales bacterium]
MQISIRNDRCRDKKQILYSHFSHIDGSNIIVVIKEIEKLVLCRAFG